MAWRLPVPESETLVDVPDGRIVAVPADPAPFRILTARTVVGGDPVVIQVGRSEALMRTEVRNLALLLVLGLPLSVRRGRAGRLLAGRPRPRTHRSDDGTRPRHHRPPPA